VKVSTSRGSSRSKASSIACVMPPIIRKARSRFRLRSDRQRRMMSAQPASP
jgi:hypothetical protein